MKESCATPRARETSTETDAGDAAPSAAEPLRILVLTDGRAGNENPARALAEAVAERWRADAPAAPNETRPEIETLRLVFRPGAELLPAAVWDRLGPQAVLGSLVDRGEALRALPPADLLIGAGRRSAPIVAALRRAATRSCRAAQILWPQMTLEPFDWVIAPRHDRIPRRVLEGPHADRLRRPLGAFAGFDAARLAARRSRPDPRIDDLARPLVGVLVGGAGRRLRFDADHAETLAEACADLAASGCGIAATGSRRTPPRIATLLAERIRAAGGFWWDGADPNPYPAILAKADALIVTADSVNMVSEAAATGRAVYVAPAGRAPGKLMRFGEEMRASGHVRDLSDAPRDASVADWRPPALQELPPIADEIARALASLPEPKAETAPPPIDPPIETP